MSDYVSEAGHWYDGDGNPAYTQETKSGKNKGKERNTTLRDARKLGLVPSVTTIGAVLDKPGLTRWKINQAIDKTIAQINGDEWVEDTSAARGTEIHGFLESFIQTGKVTEEGKPYIKILEAVMETTGALSPIAERSFTSPLGYGGAVDLHDPTGDGIIIDFKTKDMFLDEYGVLLKDNGEGKDDTKMGPLVYDEHITQLAAYRMGLGLPKAKLYNLFLSRIDPEVYILHEWSEEDAQWGWEKFMATFKVWKLDKRFDPATGRHYAND